jgi:hypothetical protein
MSWIEVDKDLPDDWRVVAATGENWGRWRKAVCARGAGWMDPDTNQSIHGVTHWFDTPPLPESARSMQPYG